MIDEQALMLVAGLPVFTHKKCPLKLSRHPIV
jgi:hypothetical protein